MTSFRTISAAVFTLAALSVAAGPASAGQYYEPPGYSGSYDDSYEPDDYAAAPSYEEPTYEAPAYEGYSKHQQYCFSKYKSYNADTNYYNSYEYGPQECQSPYD